MKQGEKTLLLRDLCARFPYSVICSVTHKKNGELVKEDMKLSGIFEDGNFYFLDKMGSTYSDNYIPYLRPMSSMTSEEEEEFFDLCTFKHSDGFTIDECCGSNLMLEKFDWLNKHHFDYRGLIEKGLAIEATTDMYNN